MLGDEYRPQQMPDHRPQAQPALAAKMRPQLRMTQVGNGVAVLAVAASGGAIYTFPHFTGATSGSGWAVAALVASVVMLAICTFQQLAWQRVMAQWKGQRADDGLVPLSRISWVVHLVSYAVVLFGLWVCIAGSVAAGATADAAGLLAFALLFMVAAQVLAGVQYLRASGPAGTIPGHLRRLAAAIQRRR